MTGAVLPGGSSRPRDTGRIAYVVTHPMTVEVLLRDQLAFLVREGFEIHVLAGPGAVFEPACEATSYQEIRHLTREIGVLGDLLALVELYRALRRLKPDIVNASTPKAGLLGMLAGRFARIPHRIYTLRGLRLETAQGAKRAVLTTAEKVAAACAHRVVSVSESLRTRAVASGLAPGDKIAVLGHGSSNGVDPDRFHGGLSQADLDLRAGLDLAPEAPVVGFLGRLTRDKGIGDLIAAFTRQVRSRLPGARLLIVGDHETGDSVPGTIQRDLERNPAVVLAGWVEDSAPYYRIMDVLAFPSYREGFPNAPLEAAASEIPVVGYAATGTVDAIEHGATGILVPVGDTVALGDALCAYLLDAELRRRHGKAGRARAIERFRSQLVWNEWKNLYLQELDS